MDITRWKYASTIVPALMASLWLGACASTTPVPTTEMALAEAAVKSASTGTTSEYAPAQLQLAKSRLSSAQQALLSKDYERAKQLAEQAQVDAQAARVHAQAASSRKAAQESRDAARVLAEELSRKAALSPPIQSVR